MLELKLILEITAGVILGKFIYQYLIDDLIQGYLKKKLLKKMTKILEEQQSQSALFSGTLTDALNNIQKQKTDLH